MPDIVNTLAELGATRSTLTPAQSDQLDQFGYLPLPGILDEVTLEALRVRCDELSTSEADRAGIEAHQEEGTARLANLVDKDRMFDRCWNHPAEILLLGDAGTCVVFNGHLWHGGTTNNTDRPRHALHAAFLRREHPQQTVQRDYLRPETIRQLSSAQRYLLDV